MRRPRSIIRSFFFLAMGIGVVLFSSTTTIAQGPKTQSPAEIYHSIEKLGFLGTALYVAAHPDDENTRLIAWLDNEAMARTAYLSLTRGDGGQNLIGPEIRELLGVIRTQELLMARSVDGGEQMFSRANDFGYSKSPEETLNIWEDEKVMADVVRAIRKFKPDVIINRFDHETSRRTHGHHTASAMLSVEAFDLAGSKEAFPEQLDELEAWQPRRIFFNTSWWFYGSREAFAEADKSKMLSVDVGTYYPWRGESNTEIAANSRSMHKCQGFGSTGTRGTQPEYLRLIKGDMPSQEGGLFEGINTSWTRVEGGAPIAQKLEEIKKNFDFKDPSTSVPALVQLRKLITEVEDDYWRDQKLKELNKIILDCAGLFIEAVTDEQFVSHGEKLEVSIEATNRSNANIRFMSLELLPELSDTVLNKELENNVRSQFTRSIRIATEISYTGPYWLKEKGSLGMYKVEDEDLIGLPETPVELKARFELVIEGAEMSVELPIRYKFNSPEDGAVYRPLEVIPPATVSIEDKVAIFADDEASAVNVSVRAGRSDLKGELKLNLPKGWKVSPEQQNVTIETKNEERFYRFMVTPPAGTQSAVARASVQIGQEYYSDELITIDYDHIPFQTVMMPCEARFVKIDVETTVQKVGYIPGAGDVIPECIAQIGCETEVIDIAGETAESLERFPTIIMGIRALNKLEELAFRQKELLKYVERGGTLVIQYNTNRGLKTENIGPYPFRISRDRTTVEEAEIRVLAPEHPVMNEPNKITSADFENWVQERGLYFPDQWSEEYTAVLSSNDPGYDPHDGGLLVTQYGEGWYVYTGYSWFRQLPAGVPGAYRLFANLISLGHGK